MKDIDGKEVWVEGPFESGLVAGLGWETREQELAATRCDRIKSATCEVTMVMEGDPAARKFMPNSIVGAEPAPMALTTTAEFWDAQRTLALGTSSKEVAAIDACKTS